MSNYAFENKYSLQRITTIQNHTAYVNIYVIDLGFKRTHQSIHIKIQYSKQGQSDNIEEWGKNWEET